MSYTKKNIVIVSCIMLMFTLGFSQTEVKRATLLRQIIPSKVEMTYTKAIIIDKKQNNIVEEGKTKLDKIAKIKTATNTKHSNPSNSIIIAIPVINITKLESATQTKRGKSKSTRTASSKTMTIEKAKT